MNTRYLTVTSAVIAQNITDKIPYTVVAFRGIPWMGLKDSFNA